MTALEGIEEILSQLNDDLDAVRVKLQKLARTEARINKLHEKEVLIENWIKFYTQSKAIEEEKIRREKEFDDRNEEG